MKTIIYLGLNDRYTKTQLHNTSDALSFTATAVARLVGFGTISQAVGCYTHRNGQTVTENTIRIELSDADAIAIKKLVRFLRKYFNQESVGVETAAVSFALM